MKEKALAEHLENAKHWVCECGERCDPCHPKWRWNGRVWQHHHEYPIGHVDAENLSPERMKEKIRFILPPEAGDGQHETLVDDLGVALRSIRDWMGEAGSGDSIVIKAVAMSDHEVEQLPEI